MADHPSSEAVAFVHGVARRFPGAGMVLGSPIAELSPERLLAMFVLTHHYCRDGVARAVAGWTRTAPSGWAAVSARADDVVRYELVSDLAFAKMFDGLPGEGQFVAVLLMLRLVRAALNNEIVRRLDSGAPVERAYASALLGEPDAVRVLAKTLTLRRRPVGAFRAYSRDELEDAAQEGFAIAASVLRRPRARLADDPVKLSDLSPLRRLRPNVVQTWDRSARQILKQDLRAASERALPLLKGLLGKEAAEKARRYQDTAYKRTLRRRQIDAREFQPAASEDDPSNKLDLEKTLNERLESVRRAHGEPVARAVMAVLTEDATERQGAYRGRLTLWRFQEILRFVRAPRTAPRLKLARRPKGIARYK